MSGDILEWMYKWANRIIAGPISFAGFVVNDFCTGLCGTLYNGLIALMGTMLNALYELGYGLLIDGGALVRPTSIAGQLEPAGGQYSIMPGLNGNENLVREAAVVPARVAIISEMDLWTTSLFAGLTPGHEHNNTNWQFAAEAAYLGFYEYYSGYTDYNDPDYYLKLQMAYLWYDGFAALWDTNRNWCTLIGGWALIGVLVNVTKSWSTITGAR